MKNRPINRKKLLQIDLIKANHLILSTLSVLTRNELKSIMPQKPEKINLNQNKRDLVWDKNKV